MGSNSLIAIARSEFHRTLLAEVLTTDRDGIPSNADRSSQISVSISKSIVGQLGSHATEQRLAGQRAGSKFEQACEKFISSTFLQMRHLRPGKWTIGRTGVGIARYEQYQHLDGLARMARNDALLSTVLGNDYIIAPDIVVGREPESDRVINHPRRFVDSKHGVHSGLRAKNNELPILHASISCKWTLRSDRAQNARSEALNLIRNRKGRLPHIVVVTGEPMPSRIASIALGTGDIDCVYHFALPELVEALNGLEYPDAQEMVEIMKNGRRLRDIADLPLDLAA